MVHFRSINRFFEKCHKIMVKTRLYYCQCIEAEVKAAKSVLWASALTFDYFRPGQSHRCSCPTKLVFQLVSVVLQGTIQKMSVQPRTLLRNVEVVSFQKKWVFRFKAFSILESNNLLASQWHTRLLTKLQVPKFFEKRQTYKTETEVSHTCENTNYFVSLTHKKQIDGTQVVSQNFFTDQDWFGLVWE